MLMLVLNLQISWPAELSLISDFIIHPKPAGRYWLNRDDTEFMVFLSLQAQTEMKTDQQLRLVRIRGSVAESCYVPSLPTSTLCPRHASLLQVLFSLRGKTEITFDSILKVISFDKEEQETWAQANSNYCLA